MFLDHFCCTLVHGNLEALNTMPIVAVSHASVCLRFYEIVHLGTELSKPIFVIRTKGSSSRDRVRAVTLTRWQACPQCIYCLADC